jgi:GntR family transcriptional repressor for pyruvate dehydrogenase complex
VKPSSLTAARREAEPKIRTGRDPVAGGRRVTRVETASERLIELITDGHIRPGERLPSEHELMSLLGVGRSSVREAIRGLTLIGIVEPKPRRGTIVVSPITNDVGRAIGSSVAIWALRDLFEVRALLEGQAAAAAARLATREQVARIGEAARAVEGKIKAGRSFFAENIAFHLAIAEASRSMVLFSTLKGIIGALRDMREHRVRLMPSIPERDMLEHRAIVAAIRARKPDEARQLMTSHIIGSVDQIEEQSGDHESR